MSHRIGTDGLGEPTYANETITPELAQHYHDLYVRNRTIRQKKVDLYTSLMKETSSLAAVEGPWYLNGEGVTFDWNGVPVNGDHRFLACIKSGVPFRTLVTRGVNPDAFPAIDGGAGRQFKDDLTIAGVPNANQAGGMLRKIICWQTNAEKDAIVRGVDPELGRGGLAGLHKFSPGRIELGKVWPQFRKEIEASMAACRKYERTWPGDRGAMLFTHWLLTKEGNNPEVIDRFFTILAHGSEADDSKVLLAVRDVLSGNIRRYKVTDGHLRQEHQVHYMLQNWNKWIKGAKLPSFVIRGNGGELSNPFPQPQRVR